MVEIVNKENKMKLRIKKIHISDLLCGIFLWFGLGIIDSNLYRPTLLFIGVLWCVCYSKIIFENKVISAPPVFGYLIFLLIYLLLIPLGDNPLLSVKYLGSYLIYFIIFLIFYTYKKNRKIKKLIIISEIMSWWIIVLSIFAIIYYSANPLAARLYITHKGDLGGLMIGGGYQLAYACTLILPFKVTQFMENKKLSNLISILIMAVLIVKTQSVITTLIALIGCYISFIFSGRKDRRSIKIITAIILVMIIWILKSKIGYFLLDISNGKEVVDISTLNNTVYMRIRDIGNLLVGNEIGANTALQLRLNNYMRPLGDILNKPLTGSLFSSGVCVETSNFNDSTILTALVTWGIPLTVLNLFPILRSLKYYSMMKGSIVALILILLLNPSEGFSLYACTVVILPCLAYQQSFARENSI